MGAAPKYFRYHLILGDGHRSQFNLALQVGATALALKAIDFDPDLLRRVKKVSSLPLEGSWVKTIRRFNLLAEPGKPPRVDPIVLEVQRLYQEAARRYAAALHNPPDWIARLLRDWQETLDALERRDRTWLAARLDAFAKYELLSGVLAAAGYTWEALPRKARLFSELALIDHSFHEFAEAGSAFRLIEEQNLLRHRVGEMVSPGKEAQPWVPETTTRARARARFIREHEHQRHFCMDWSCVHDILKQRWKRLDDPFAPEYDPWETPAAGRG